MTKPLLAAMAALMVLSACSSVRESRANPLNWFGGGGGSRSAPGTLEPPGGFRVAEADARPLVAEVTQMSVEPMPGGVIVRATALQPTQGYWEAALVPENDGRPVDGVMTFRFVALPPLTPSAVSTPQSRLVTAAAYVPDSRLAGVRQITVLGSTASRSSGR
ncbi:hypothetical protein [Halodurantibacterium flavum]|uniref:Lipoprotein n=1 Tax=Halodurantibacterium flavum TaxID=1382802 RepID=A0ABW4S192_9RHOB